MKLTLSLIGERVKPSTYSYANPQNEEYRVAEVAIEGSTSYVANSLRALAESIDPKGSVR